MNVCELWRFAALPLQVGRSWLKRHVGKNARYTIALLLASPAAAKPELTIVSYNVENLFDTAHDPGQDDYLFLPAKAPQKRQYCATKRRRRTCLAQDWTTAKFTLKLTQIKEAVWAAGAGHRPDLLAVVEIENANAAQALAAVLGYDRFAITTGHDRRGIDQALFWHSAGPLTQVSMRQHRVYASQDVELRPILEVYFKYQRHDLLVLVNHWPSQAAPLRLRLVCAQHLAGLAHAALRRNPALGILATGDFNVIDRENSDIRAAVQPLQEFYEPGRQPGGTYFFRRDRQWHRFDRFFLSPTLRDGRRLEVVGGSLRVMADSRFTEDFFPLRGAGAIAIPRRYDFRTTFAWRAGYSDHFPIRLALFDAGG